MKIDLVHMMEGEGGGGEGTIKIPHMANQLFSENLCFYTFHTQWKCEILSSTSLEDLFYSNPLGSYEQFEFCYELKKMKIAPLGLAGGRSYDRTNSLRTPTMKESQLLREKNHFLGLSFNMFKRCACPVSLTCIHTQHQCDVFCLQSKHFRSIAGMIAPPAKIYAREKN